MSELKMGPIISQIREEVEKPKTFIRRMFSSVKWRVSRIVWALWGRRRTFAKMQKLALSGYNRQLSLPTIKSEEERLAKYRDGLDRETLPQPDANDSGLN
jgi:hypothetical protein